MMFSVSAISAIGRQSQEFMSSRPTCVMYRDPVLKKGGGGGVKNIVLAESGFPGMYDALGSPLKRKRFLKFSLIVFLLRQAGSYISQLVMNLLRITG